MPFGDHSRLDISAIETELRSLQFGFSAIQASGRDPVDDEVVGNMLAAYTLVDQWLADGIDLFAPGNSRCWLELNACVLGSTEPSYLAASEERFYDETLGGIRDVTGWYDEHRGDGVWKRAAGVYVQIVAEPQLFLEGNHRCGILIASWLLGNAGEPPVVMGRDTAAQFFQQSALIQQTPKHSFAMLFRLPAFRRRLVTLFRQSVRLAYLR